MGPMCGPTRKRSVPADAVPFYRGTIKIFSNPTMSLEDGLVLIEDKLKEQVVSLELGTMFVLCSN
jgi:hypothetical protein